MVGAGESEIRQAGWKLRQEMMMSLESGFLKRQASSLAPEEVSVDNLGLKRFGSEYFTDLCFTNELRP